MRSLLQMLVLAVITSCVGREAQPMLTPQPWKMELGKTAVALSPPVFIISGEGASIAARDAMTFVRGKLGSDVQILRPGKNVPKNGSLILISQDGGRDISHLSDAGIPECSSRGKLGDEGYVLRIKRQAGRTVVSICSGSDKGAYYGVQTLKQLAEASAGSLGLPECTITDRPALDIRGFKGLYWRPEQYLEMMQWIPTQKFNFHMLCYTMYPENASEWRKPYSEEQLAQMKAISDYLTPRYVTVCLAINPSIWAKRSLEYSSDEELRCMVDKLKSVYDVGIRCFAICFDDIPLLLQHEEDRKRFSGLGDAQADFMKRLKSEMDALPEAVKLIFCPTTYTTSWASRGEAEKEYVHTIGQELPEGIEVFWTGREVRSESITAADADLFGEWIRRKPFVWDNYPVNDDRGSYLRLGAVKNRSTDLSEHISGWISNPLMQSEASKIPLATIADYLWNPTGYDPDRSLRASVMQLGGREAYRDLIAVVRLYSAFYGEAPRIESISSIRESMEMPRAAEAFSMWKPVLERLQARKDLQRLNADILPAFGAYVSALKRKAGLVPPKKWTSSGILLTGDDFAGGGAELHGSNYRGTQSCNWVYARSTGSDRITAEFVVEGKPPSRCVFRMRGMDDDPPDPCRIRISLNGTVIAEGPSGFPNGSWSEREFSVPSGSIEQGPNILTIENLHDSGPADNAPWFMISRVSLTSAD